MASPILESAAPDDVTGAALVVLRRPRGIRIPGAIWIGGSLLGAMILICFVGPLFDHANETNARNGRARR